VQTYLDADKVLEACRRSGADAVHPGYGFLSENANFAEAIVVAGITWVGPPPHAIAAMGDKLSAKKLMQDADVATLPAEELPPGGDYAAAAARARQANIDISIRYTVPKEGSGLWVDGVYIPADAKHKDNAYTFINFLMRPDIAADLSNEVQYANANRSSWEFTRPEIMNDPAIYPDSDVWERIYRVNPIEPKRERPRTRAFARVKSGI
jgi:spermidine/putrescine-binding protein